MERALTGMLRADAALDEAALGEVRLGGVPEGREREALLRRREAVGLPLDADAPVLVDHEGHAPDPALVGLFLRRARSTRISIDGNAHFCRGLLRTRYDGSGADQAPRPEGAEPADHHHLLSLTPKES
jgi:hypothetical protein